VTAITRTDSTAVIPAGVTVAKVNYSDPSTLVAALKGQDALVITMAVTAPLDTQAKLIDAAAEADVPWIIPSEWGTDPTKKRLEEETMLGAARHVARKLVEERGKSSWIGIASGFWYEFSLAGSQYRYGFDFRSKSVVFYDDGNTKINTTTWPQTGLTIANLLSLKVNPENNTDSTPSLSQFRNKTVYVSSFLVSQKDIFESVLRVTGDKADAWKISYQPSVERYKEGLEQMQKGDRRGFGKALYARVFYQDGSGNHEDTSGLQNELLGLPNENLDEFTKIAIQMAEAQEIPY
jgi:hypothetical protein